LEQFDIRPLAATLHIPVLAMTGSQDPIVPAEQARWLGLHSPCVEVKEFAQVGHMPFIESPDEYQQALDDWLTRHPV
jgi:pimeloyl-ACP methyl ester carboxylesterase